MAGRIPMPLVPPLLGPLLGMLERTGKLYVPSRYDRTLRFGRGVSTRRMIEEFGFTPEYTTREAAEKYANYIRVKRYHDREDASMLDGELLDYVQRKMQQMPSVQGDAFARFARRVDDVAVGSSALDDDEEFAD
jgi:UDP-glucose 4-epimerase